MFKNYRLGIDLGSTSLGWCMLELDSEGKPCGIINMGARVFSDGRDAQSHEPLSVTRRAHRSARRNLDRYLFRVRTLIDYLQTHGFLPQDEQQRSEVFTINPYFLRAKALDEKLSPAEFARAIIHLAKKRGFKSNRKTDSDAKTAYTDAINNLRQRLNETGARTLGEFLWQKFCDIPVEMQHKRKPIKFRYEKGNEEDIETIFPTRDIVLHEFLTIWDSQSKHNLLFTDEHKQMIEEIIFKQNPLKPQERGKCQLLPEFDRAPKAHPLFQEFRIRQELNNLRLIDAIDNTPLEFSFENRELCCELLFKKDQISFEKIRKTLFSTKADDYRFTVESEAKKKIVGDLTYCAFHKRGKDDLAELWDSSNLDIQENIIELLISDLDDEAVASELLELSVPRVTIEKLLNLKLPEGFSNLSLEAIRRILPHLRKGEIYSKACELAGFHHSMDYNGEIFNEGDLPYYGEVLRRETLELNRKTGDLEADAFGKINNPSVHIALNQLRKLVNTIIRRYKKAPLEIVLELGKELKLSTEKLDEVKKEIVKNTKNNDKIAQTLEEHGLTVNHDNILRIKLWEELAKDEIDRRCIYSGRQISFADLFCNPPKVEIEHILPKSRTYDDSTANKTISFIHANRYKGERSPFEAFGESLDEYDWQQIVNRSKKLPPNKERRFHVDAMQRFEDESEVLSRMLNDTRYMSRVAMKYMMYVVGANKVWSITGRHTAMLRSKWGLNSALGDTDKKERTDHRHHAIDAFVIALTSRSFVKHLADCIRKSRERYLEKLDPPYPGFSHDQFKEVIDSIMTSHKPDQINTALLRKRNQTAGVLVEDTAYSFLRVDPDNPKYSQYTVRKGIKGLSKTNIKDIVSPELRKIIENIASVTDDEGAFKARLAHWAKEQNVKNLKMLLKKKPETMTPVKDKQGKIYKYYHSGENLFADVYISDPTNPQCKWAIEIVNSYNAHQENFQPEWKKKYPKGKKVMRLFKNDIVALDNDEGKRELKRVRMMSKGSVYLREINVAQKPKNKEDIGEQYPPSSLLKQRACKAGIDIIGRYFDPIGSKNDSGA